MYCAACDAFTIGGMKNGLLFGEALVIVNPALQPGFRNCMKQQGAMLAIINVHDRMPVLLTDDEVIPWLRDTGMASAKLTALQPALERMAV